MMGDVNLVLNMNERIGSTVRWHEIEDLRECIEACELTDMKQAGRFFTWINKQDGKNKFSLKWIDYW